jgi:membrane fusion protein
MDDRADAPPPFLEADPPHWAARGLTYVLILLFIVAGASAAFVHVPEVVSSPFTLTPLRGGDPVRAPRRGVVSDVRVSEGLAVERDQGLFVIGSQDIGDRSAELRDLEAQLAGAAETRAIARRKRENERQAEREEQGGLERRIADLAKMMAVKDEQVALQREIVERRKRLLGEGLTSLEDLSAKQLELRQLAIEFEQLDADRRGAQASLAKLGPEARARDAEFTEIERRLNEDVKRFEIRASMLRTELANSEGSSLVVPAPCAGTVLRLVIRAAGAVVQEGEALAELMCGGDELQAELSVPQGGMGRVQLGQPVKLLYDAFPYQRFGVRMGTVRWVSPASVDVGGANVFRVSVAPDDRAIVIDGRERPLIPGMSGRAQIVVGRRSLLTYAIAPLRQLRESVTTPAPRKTAASG